MANPNDPRKFKKFLRKQGMANPIRIAYEQGMGDAYYLNPQSNKYPPGKRHDAYLEGFAHGIEDRNTYSRSRGYY